MIKVTVWNEFYHERTDERARAVYPEGIHACIREFLQGDGIEVHTATLDETECGLTEEVLQNTDVLIWWGHLKHKEVPDEIAWRVVHHVQNGMGVVFLHSGHHSKPFRFLMGTPCHLSWRENGDMERVWVVNPAHPIAQGLDRYFELPHEETYSEPFSIPEPDELVLMGWYEGGEVIRSGCCDRRGNGHIFYFQPGHETFPTFKVPEVQTVIRNAVRWAAPTYRQEITCPHIKKIGTEEV